MSIVMMKTHDENNYEVILLKNSRHSRKLMFLEHGNRFEHLGIQLTINRNLGHFFVKAWLQKAEKRGIPLPVANMCTCEDARACTIQCKV